MNRPEPAEEGLIPDETFGMEGDSMQESMAFRPFLSIWTHPRATIRRIVHEDPERCVTLLAMCSGIARSLDRAANRNAGDKLPLEAILGIAVILGPLGGLFGIWVMSHLTKTTGDWIGGVASRAQLKAALAWACVPSIVQIVLWAMLVVMFGQNAFTKETPQLDEKPWLGFPAMAIGIAFLVTSAWMLIISSKCVAEVQGFRSAWRGLWNVFLSFTLAIGVIILAAIPVVIIVAFVGGSS